MHVEDCSNFPKPLPFTPTSPNPHYLTYPFTPHPPIPFSNSIIYSYNLASTKSACTCNKRENHRKWLKKNVDCDLSLFLLIILAAFHTFLSSIGKRKPFFFCKRLKINPLELLDYTLSLKWELMFIVLLEMMKYIYLLRRHNQTYSIQTRNQFHVTLTLTLIICEQVYSRTDDCSCSFQLVPRSILAYKTTV